MSAFSFVRRTVPTLLSVLGICAAGCAVGTDPAGGGGGEDVASSNQALGESSCATADADATFEGGIDYATPSGSPYSNAKCFKSTVVDVNHYSADQSALANGTGVFWGDFEATDQATCEGQYVRAVLYEFHDGGPGVIGGYYKVDDMLRLGVWLEHGASGSGNAVCDSPSVHFEPLRATHRYRIAATARSGGVTRRLTMKSYSVPSTPPPSCDTCVLLPPKAPVAEPSP